MPLSQTRPRRSDAARDRLAARDPGRASRASLLVLAVRLALVLASVLALGAGCVLPGRLYPVAPAVHGRLVDFDPGLGEARLELVILHRESQNLHAKQRVTLDPGGRFEFAPTRLAIAGQEYSKYYRFYLHLQVGDADEVIWRAQRSRRARSGDITLECDLERPLRLGQRCQVQNPLQHDWLIAEGERTYQRLCESCHGPAGRLPRPELLSGRARPADLTTIAARWGGHFDRKAVAARIVGDAIPDQHRDGEMPIWGERLSTRFERYAEGDELVGATLDPLVVYLETLQREIP